MTQLTKRLRNGNKGSIPTDCLAEIPTAVPTTLTCMQRKKSGPATRNIVLSLLSLSDILEYFVPSS